MNRKERAPVRENFAQPVTFCATGRSGLGHLRRVANIAQALNAMAPSLRIELVVNAPVGGLSKADLTAFSTVRQVDRASMSAALAPLGGPVVVDTAVLPGLEALDRKLCLVLRETPAELCARFELSGGRLWDLVVLPNPPGAWAPPESLRLGRRVASVGWIYRAPPAEEAARGGTPVVLVASGGGGKMETAAAFRDEMDRILAMVRDTAPPFRIVQNLGPRAPRDARLALADEIIHAEGDLNRWFAQADVVISTAGYNSVLELALTDTPTLLFGIDRTFDDQWARMRDWGGRLGLAYDPSDASAAVRWMAKAIASRRRRPPLDLGPSGAEAAARAIRELAREQ